MDISKLNKDALDIIRKRTVDEVATELCSVQPMSENVYWNAIGQVLEQISKRGCFGDFGHKHDGEHDGR